MAYGAASVHALQPCSVNCAQLMKPAARHPGVSCVRKNKFVGGGAGLDVFAGARRNTARPESDQPRASAAITSRVLRFARARGPRPLPDPHIRAPVARLRPPQFNVPDQD